MKPDLATVLVLPDDLNISDLKTLESHKGWRVVMTYLATEMADLFGDFEKATTMEEVAKLQGTINGIKLALQAPETIRANEVLDDENKQNVEESEDEK